MDIKNLKSVETEHWHDLDVAYSASKRMFILAEEKLKNMELFPAPLLEHRDALDHIMRYSRLIEKNGLCNEAISELANAKQHEIRAFFDIADYICITIRLEIASTLDVLTKRQITKIWPDYKDVRKKVINLSTEIAEIRTERKETIDAIPRYEVAVDKMFEVYQTYQLEVLPKIGKGFIYRLHRLLNG